LKEKDKQIGDLSRALNNQQGLTKQKPKKPRKKPRKSKAKKNNLLKRIFST